MTHDIQELERELRALGESIAKLANAKHAEKLDAIIHRPGFTTEREHEFMRATVNALHYQVIGFHNACDALHLIAGKIGALNPQPLPPSPQR
ncbi:MAG: hypothetical protein WBX22_05455 [Silvibacterium sp.]